MQREFLALALCCASLAASAQLADADPDWKELDAPPPPALRTSGLIAIDVPGSSLHFGVDPNSVAIGTDGVVRYVVVAQSSSGTVNGIYEGVRCSTGEVRVFARHNPSSGWVATTESPWRALSETPNNRYSLTIARDGMCLGQAPNQDKATILRDLRTPADRKFTGSGG
ncbi:hypothetical protein HHL11_29865 [Ramlibacter sp. G-1-2-2]|uniref:CNP1-like uncharacterized domain-containing protein n=1 Tax=Ramlibacter agri TaxID=2728837 RepID=A0A848HHJ7_9BURK|nr:CNP1-like family protein [Ramlibacter agri]NML47993.1 hypothetical protein [Ramlibacter agri]